ncbi:hypothetical protein [Streptomyces sp. NPDC002602]|uniref:hypothetical protein n=1 Tax=Streptomyces sp. NPDC002602 TaxID=3364654 RepID=UPI0036893E0C
MDLRASAPLARISGRQRRSRGHTTFSPGEVRMSRSQYRAFTHRSRENSAVWDDVNGSAR